MPTHRDRQTHTNIQISTVKMTINDYFLSVLVPNKYIYVCVYRHSNGHHTNYTGLFPKTSKVFSFSFEIIEKQTFKNAHNASIERFYCCSILSTGHIFVETLTNPCVVVIWIYMRKICTQLRYVSAINMRTKSAINMLSTIQHMPTYRAIAEIFYFAH